MIVLSSRYFRLFKTMLQGIMGMGLAGCTTIAAGRKATSEGSVMIGHNEDNSGQQISLYAVPEVKHREGEILTLNGGAGLPQPPVTWSYLWSETPGQFFCDFYLNSWGVVIASNSAPSKEDDLEVLKQNGQIIDGGIDYWLRRLVAERSRCAKEGIELAVSLIERLGYNDSGRMYEIADHDEVWILQVAAGKHYCARRVPDDEVAVIPNSYTIGELDFTDDANFIFSPDLAGYSASRGWYDPADGKPFLFNQAYGRQGQGILSERGFDPRQWIGQRLLLERDPDCGPLPFSVKPAHPLTVGRMKQILRNHFEGTVFGLRDGNRDTPHSNTNHTICSRNTVESIIIQMRKDMPDGMDAVMWRALGRPCCSIYVPFYKGIDRVPAGYGSLNYEEAIKTHFRRDADFFENTGTAWRTFHDLQQYVDTHYEETARSIENGIIAYEEEQSTVWSAFERKIMSQCIRVERKKDAGTKELQEKLADFSCSAAIAAWNRARDLSNVWKDAGGLPPDLPPG